MHQYKNRDNFFISLDGKNSSDCMYLLKTGIELSVDEVIEGSVKGDHIWESMGREKDSF